MTVPVSDRQSQLYVGNGVNVRFDFIFQVFDQEGETGISVSQKIGNDFELIDESLYVVTTNQDGMGGYITFVDPPSSSTSFYIRGNTPVDQLLDITNYDNFYPDAIERSLDKLTAIVQEVLMQISLVWLVLKQEIQDRIDADLAIRAWVGVLLNNIVDSGLVSAIAVTTVDSVNDLQSLVKWHGRTIYVKSYHLNLGKGGGTRIYDSSLSGTNDDFLCINGWVLQLSSSEVSPELAGAKGDGSTDDRSALQRVIDSRFILSLMPNTVYVVSNALLVYGYTKIIGAGVHSSVIRKIGTRSDTGFGMSYDGNYSYEIDAILITKDYVYSLRLDDFSIDRSNAVENVDDYRLYSNATGGAAENVPSGYGLFSNALAKSKIGNFESFGSEYPIYIVDSWLNSWTNIHADGCQGWTILTGTSNNFVDCWSSHTQGGVINGKQYCAYDIKGYYHNFVTVAADHVGEEEKPVRAAYKLEGGGITIGALGAETVHAKRLIEANGNETSIDIDTIYAIGVRNKYRTSANKDEGLIAINDASYLNITAGTITVTGTADTSNKPCFAELRTASKLRIGDVKLNLKISGINDNSINQIFKESGCAFVLDSSNTKIYKPSDESTFAWAEYTYSGDGTGAVNLDCPLRIGSHTSTSTNSEIQFRSGGTLFKDGSIKISTSATPTADYSIGALKYSAFQHEFYGKVLLPATYSNTTAAASNLYISTDGQLFRSTSSLKYKENVQSVEIDLASQIVESLRAVTFTSKVDKDKERVHFGFIAEEVAEIDSRLCFFDGSEVEGVQYDRIIPALIRYIQQLNERIKQLENQ